MKKKNGRPGRQDRRAGEPKGAPGERNGARNGDRNGASRDFARRPGFGRKRRDDEAERPAGRDAPRHRADSGPLGAQARGEPDRKSRPFRDRRNPDRDGLARPPSREDRPRKGRPGEDRAREDRPRADGSRKDRPRQARAGQGRPRQEWSREDRPFRNRNAQDRSAQTRHDQNRFVGERALESGAEPARPRRGHGGAWRGGETNDTRPRAANDRRHSGAPARDARRGPAPDRPSHARAERSSDTHSYKDDKASRSFDGRRKPPVRRDRRDSAAPRGEPESRDGRLWIYGHHAGLAAIRNPARRIIRILAAEGALDWLKDADVAPERRALIERSTPQDVGARLPDGAVHQGLAVEVEALPRARLREVCLPDARRRPVLVLDQITDPHNIGAILRSAAAFGAAAVIVQDRRTPPLAGALAKAAAGAVETVPCVEVVNIARALEGLKGMGYVCAGLAADAARPLADMPREAPVAIVLGAEGAGLRRLVAETCDAIFRIPIDPGMESLNVSISAALALYELHGRGAA